MKNIKYKDYLIMESDVKKLRSYPKKQLDKIEDFHIYVLFLQSMSSSSYHENCIGIKLLNYMEEYRKESELILPMRRFLLNGDDSYFNNPKYKKAYC